MIEIAVIINSYNRFSLLKECIASLLWIENSKFSDRIGVVIFEAGSSDGSIEWLKSQQNILKFPLEIIQPNKEDDNSFAVGINVGVKYAQSKFPNLKYVLFYETDNQIKSQKPLDQALSLLIIRKNLAACGFTVKKHNGSFAGIGMPFPRLINFLLGNQLVQRLNLEKITFHWDKDIEGTEFSFVDVVFTSPLLVKLEAWEQSDGLNTKLFPFSDCDVDWAKRLQHLAWKIGVIKSEEVIHDNRETISAWSRTRAMQFHRSRLRYFKRFHPTLIYIIWPIPLIIRHIIELIIVKMMVWNPERRKQLSLQFSGLIRRCLFSYE